MYIMFFCVVEYAQIHTLHPTPTPPGSRANDFGVSPTLHLCRVCDSKDLIVTRLKMKKSLEAINFF